MARDIEAGRAFVRVSIKENLKGLKRMSRKLKSWGAGIAKVGAGVAGLGGAATAGLVAMTNQFAAAGDQVHKMSLRLGTSAEFISALGHAAALGGADIETMEKGIRRLQRSALDASRGLSTQVNAFDRLGISVENADGSLKGSEKLFMETATALSAMTNETEKAAVAQMVFGRAGTSLIPMLTEGKDGLNAAMQEAKELGLVLNDEDAAAAAAATDAFHRLQSTLKAVTMRIGAALAPALTEMSEKLARVVSQVVQFVRENQPAIVSIAKIVGVVTAAGGALMALGGILAVAGITVGGIVAGITSMGAVLGAVLSPIALVVAGVAGATAAFLGWTDAGQQTVAFLQDKFAGLLDGVKVMIDGIVNAFKAGDIQLAAQIAWQGVMVAWEGVKQKLMESWNMMAGVWDEFTTGLAIMFDSVVTKIRTAWSHVTEWIADKMLKVWGIIEKALAAVGLLDRVTDIGGAAQALAEDASRQRAGLAGGLEARNAARAQGMADRAAARTTSGTGVEEAKMELGRLLVEAATQAEAVAAKRAQEAAGRGGEDGGPGGSADLKSLGTFSAVAASMAFRGKQDTTAQKTEENTRKTVEVLKGIQRNTEEQAAFL